MCRVGCGICNFAAKVKKVKSQHLFLNSRSNGGVLEVAADNRGFWWIKAREIEEEKKAMAEFGSSDSGASLGDILGAALAKKETNSQK